MKLLLAVDGSDCSTRAARQLVKLARALRKRASVVLIHVDTPIMKSVAIRLGAERTRELHLENGEAALKAARSILSIISSAAIRATSPTPHMSRRDGTACSTSTNPRRP